MMEPHSRTHNTTWFMALAVTLVGVLLWQVQQERGSPVHWVLSFTHKVFGLEPSTYVCTSNYTVEILSVDPLIMYINNWLSDEEISHLLGLAEPTFRPSMVYHDYSDVAQRDLSARKSVSAVLPRTDPVTSCLTRRFQSLLGNVQHQEIEPLQAGRPPIPNLVKYAAGGDKFDIHFDWFGVPKNDTPFGLNATDKPEAIRPSNRLTSIFAYLDDNCTRGETFFPHTPRVGDSADGTKYAAHGDEDGVWGDDDSLGLMVKPIKGNAIFWVNLLPDGTGDVRTAHAGLPIGEGTKVGMNMWSRGLMGSPMVGV